MPIPADEYPLHQAPYSLAHAATSDRNFYDRCYLNCFDTEGDFLLVSGLGQYPNLGTTDAFVCVRVGDHQHVVRTSDALGPDRMRQEVGPYRLEIVDPLSELHLTCAGDEWGVAVDLHWRGSFPAVDESPHLMRTGAKLTLDAQRFAQVGTWEGWVRVAGTEYPVVPGRHIGTRDRSWGIRPVGEREPAGRPADPPFEGMWWLYVPMAFDDFAIVVILQEEPSGFRSLNDCTRIWRDGRIEQLGWPRVTIHYRSGTRIPTGATIDATDADGRALHFDVESKLAVPIHVGGGYGGDIDWLHGEWKGEKFTERRTYDMTDPAIVGRAGFGVIDHVGRAVCRQPDGTTTEGWGLFEHGALGRHDPSGFADWLTVAP